MHTQTVQYEARALRRPLLEVNTETQTERDIESLELHRVAAPVYPADWPENADVLVTVTLAPNQKETL